MSRLATLAAVAVITLTGKTTRAQVAADPEEHIRRGIELRREHRNAEALAEFEEANARVPSPRARAQAALAELALGRWVEAERGLVEALGTETDPWILKNRKPLAEALDGAREHLGDLFVDANEAGAEVWVDGSMRGVVPLPGPLRVVAGEVVVEVRAARRTAVRRTVRVPGSGAAPAHEAFALTATSEEGPHDAARLPVASLPSPPSPMRDAPGRPAAGWLLLGSAGVAVGVGAVAAAVNSSEASIYNDDGRCLVGTMTRDAQCGGHRANAQAAEAVAITGFAVASVAAIAGVTILVMNPRKPTRVGCSVGLGGVTCGGGFVGP